MPKQSEPLWVTTSGSSFKVCMSVWMLEPFQTVFLKGAVQWFSKVKCSCLRQDWESATRSHSVLWLFQHLVVWWLFTLMRPMPSKHTCHQAKHLGSCWEIAMWWIFLGIHEDIGALVSETVLEILVYSDPLSNQFVDQLPTKLKERKCLYLSNSQSSRFLGIIWEEYPCL